MQMPRGRHKTCTDERRGEACNRSTAKKSASSLQIGQSVACAAHRNPHSLVKMACTVDVLSRGRPIVYIGASDQFSEFREHGRESALQRESNRRTDHENSGV